MFEKHKSYIPAVILMLILKLLSPTSQAEQANTSGFDFSAYDSVLKTFVNEKAMVNYRMLKAQRRRLDAFVAALGKLPRRTYEKWDDKHKIAFWLNAYNGLTLKAIIDNYPIKSSFLRSRFWPKNSIRQIPGVWKELKFTVMGSQVTLWHIEHEILRKKFDEPRIHMAMVCAAMGCPPLRGEPYEGGKLDEQLDDQTRRFLADSGKFKIDSRKGTVHLSEIFNCFAEDLLSMVESLDVGLRLMFHPLEAMSELRRWLGDRHNYRPQSGDDLGARLKSAFVGAFEEGFSKVVAIGSDSPDLPGDFLREAFDALESHDAVIGPSSDGGYYLIGFSRDSFVTEAFDNIAWSTSAVCDQTLERLRTKRLNVHLLPIWHDVDTRADLDDLVTRTGDGPFSSSRTFDQIRRSESQMPQS